MQPNKTIKPLKTNLTFAKSHLKLLIDEWNQSKNNVKNRTIGYIIVDFQIK